MKHPVTKQLWMLSESDILALSEEDAELYYEAMLARASSLTVLEFGDRHVSQSR